MHCKRFVRVYTVSLCMALACIALCACTITLREGHGMEYVGDIVNLEHVQELRVFCYGYSYQFAETEIEDMLSLLNEIPVSKCKLTKKAAEVTAPGFDCIVSIVHDDDTKTFLVFLMQRDNDMGVIDLSFSDDKENMIRLEGEIRAEYNAFLEQTYAFAGWEYHPSAG